MRSVISCRLWRAGSGKCRKATWFAVLLSLIVLAFGIAAQACQVYHQVAFDSWTVPQTVCKGSSVTFSAIAYDSKATYPSITYSPDWDRVNFSWFASAGTVSGSSDNFYNGMWQGSVVWTAPSTVGTYTISFAICDGTNYSVPDIASTVVWEYINVTVVNSYLPSITGPVSQAICPSQTATFTVTASEPGLTYQWYNSSGPIAGATSASYTTGVADSYYCVVSCSCGSTTSATAMLTIGSYLTINTQPSAQTVCSGSTAEFTVAASGTPVRATPGIRLRARTPFTPRTRTRQP